MVGGLPLRERKKVRTAAAITDATLDLVASRGFAAIRIEDICEHAEVGRSTFFRYFDSKEAAFVAGVHQGRLDRLLAAIASRPPEEGAFVALSEGLLEMVSDWREQRAALLLESEIRAQSVDVQSRSDGELVAWQAALADQIGPRLPPGPRNRLHARVLVAAVMAAVNVVNEEWLASGALRSPSRRLSSALAAVKELLRDLP